MIRAIFFDFDGIIVDTESSYRKAWSNVLVPGQMEKFDELATGKREEDAARLLSPYFRESVPSEAVALDVKRATFLQLMNDAEYLRTLPGIYELVLSLSSKHRLHIVSNSSLPLVEGPLQLLNLHRFFEDIVCWTAGSNAKPHPDLYLRALGNADVLPSEAVALEDSRTGLEAALAAGITPVCLGNNETAIRFCREHNIAHYASAALLLDVDPDNW